MLHQEGDLATRVVRHAFEIKISAPIHISRNGFGARTITLE